VLCLGVVRLSENLDPIAPEAAVDLYLDHRRDEVAEETLQSHRYRLKAFVEWCDENGITNMNEIGGRDLHAYRVHRRDEHDLTAMTLQGQLSTLRVFLGFCASIDAVPENLRDKVLLPSVRGEEQVREDFLSTEEAESILDYLHKYEYASRAHMILLLAWQTGLRTGGIRTIDLDDYDPDAPGVELRHVPGETPLKNGHGGERWVALRETTAEVVNDCIADQRIDIRDDYGREPLLTTQQGRPATGTIRNTVYRWTRPCVYSDECPHDREPRKCEATGHYGASKCPSSVAPNDVRSGAITAHLLDDVPIEVVSDRMDVSDDVLDRHYDRRSEREKMEQRREYLQDA